MDEKYRTTLVLTLPEGEYTFDLVSSLGERISDYVRVWADFARHTGEITEENFCYFIRRYEIDAYPYNNPDIGDCPHDYGTINNKLKCKKCGYEL